ncbi:MAG TPA: c-type cytochrome [Flavobacterium sp.]|uniref:c-type cytochrome n=1 Tax=unclassified Flavobacterium TaxID=196869 RepID=UPI000E9E0A7D|nr:MULTISPECIES: c-type cytochrome [unclassified Flavobacterium]HBI01132.1 cytochrome C552 [Flavobacterium sp.]HRE77724.1 c-type cytochrome [Flavobacterium sp.]
MKKIVVFVVFVMLFSCQNKKEESFGTDSKSVSEVTDDSVEAKIKLGEELFNGVGLCHTCHKPDQKVIGPSIKEIATIYKEQNADMVDFLRENAKPIVDPTQYEVMKTNFAVTKSMSDEELQAIELYMHSLIK